MHKMCAKRSDKYIVSCSKPINATITDDKEYRCLFDQRNYRSDNIQIIKSDIDWLNKHLEKTDIDLIFSDKSLDDKPHILGELRHCSEWMPQWLKDIIRSGDVDNLYSHESLRECCVCKTLNEFMIRKIGDSAVLPANDTEELLILESKNYTTMLFKLIGIEERYGRINAIYSCPIDKWNEFKSFMNPLPTTSSSSTYNFINKGGCYLLIKEQDFGITPLRVKVGMSEKNVIKDRICKAKEYQNAYVLSCHMLSKPVECKKEILEEFRKNFTSHSDIFEMQSIEDAVRAFDEICFKYI